jgi:2-dehydro-3-deoxygluconokinase
MTERNRAAREAPELVCIGEALVQLAPPPGSRLGTATNLGVHIGGAELNVAVAVASLGHKCAFVTRLGTDPFGARVLRTLETVGVDSSLVCQDSERPTGVYFKDYDGERTVMHYYRSASAASAMGPADVGPWAQQPAWFHVSGVFAALGPSCLSFLEQLLDRVAAAGGKVSFDVNYRPGLWSVDEAAEPLLRIARRADLVFTGQDEAATLWGTTNAKSVCALLPSVAEVVVKDGAVGTTSIGADGTVFVPSLPIRVIEPVGAGDAFAAGYLSATLRCLGKRTALRWGHLFASKAMMSVGDQVQAPSNELLRSATDISEEEWASIELLATT